MQEAEAETSTDPEPRCRLCLQWTDTVDGLQNIFNEDDGSFPFKIRDCLGVLVSTEDSIQTVCNNCRQMVNLIDDFRMLCRQTEEIYESVVIRCDDSERWERYGEYVGELRKLVQEHKETINDRLIGLEGVEGSTDEDFISPHFVPMILLKEEPDDYDEAWSDEPMDLLDIKPGRLPNGESDEEVDGNNKAELSDGIGSANYVQRVKLAQEVLKRLEKFTCVLSDHKELWEEIAEQLGMDYSATRSRWYRMKKSYLVTKASVPTGGRLVMLRLNNCTLFNLMNQIVPQLEESVEPWVAPANVDIDERTDGKSLPIGLKIAIAEEIKNSPEIWNTSLANSSQKIDRTWNSIAEKFKIDVINLRLLWRSLQDMYEKHKKRVSLGSRVKTKADTKYYKLIEIIQHIYQTLDVEAVKQEQARVVREDAKQKKSKKVDTSVDSQKMTLAKLVHQRPHLWNQKHHNFNNGVVKDAAWDEIARTLNKTRDQTKYAWKCLREMYRCRVKRLKQGRLRPDARVLHEPLFKQLDLICAENMRIRTFPQPDATTEDDTQNPYESESEEMQEDHGEDDVVEGAGDENIKLAMLCEQNEIIWNNKHPDHANLVLRDIAWDSIAQQLNQTRFQAKVMWSRLRNMYRARRIRYLKGNLTKNSHLLRGPLYQKLNKMLKEHMQLGKYGGGINQSDLQKKTQEVGRIDTSPFSTMEDKVKLVQEVTKYEFLWNSTHPDYFKSDKRGATWNQIAEMFDNCNAFAAKNEWRRLRDMHRPRKSRAFKEPIDDNEEDEPTNVSPLYELFSKMAESLSAENDCEPAEEGESSGVTKTKKVKKRRMQEITEAYMTHKRRYTGKRIFDEEGCIKVTRGGIVRYEKVCELCGKQVERSYFEYHMNQHYGLKPYVCSIEGCDRQYSNKITRDRHEVIVHCDQGYKYECDQCQEKFKNRSTFDYHYAIKHVSNQVPCTVCGKLLKHKTLLREHLRRHTGHFSCNVCGKVLQQKYSLDVHMRTHTNEKPYACEICGQCFMLKVQMKTHLTKIHQLTWEEFQATYGSTGQQ